MTLRVSPRSSSLISLRSYSVLLLLLWGLVLALSLLSYHPTDPSFNRATHEISHNWVGMFGSYVADFFLQWFGLASFFCVFAAWFWALRILRQELSHGWGRRISALALSIASGSALLAFIPSPERWPFYVSLGGVFGDRIHSVLYVGFAFFDWIGITILVLLLIVLTFFSLGFAYAISREELQMAYNFCTRVWAALLRGFSYCMRTYKRMRNLEANAPEESTPEEESEPEEPIVELVEKKPKKRRATQQSLNLSLGEFVLPDVDLLTEPPAKKKKETISESSLTQNARLLERVLEDFNVQGSIVRVRPGPVVTLYELQPSPGTKSSRVIGLADDIARSMSAISARIAVIPGRNAIGIELPNAHRETVYLRELLESEEYRDERSRLPLTLGKDIGGDSVVTDLSRMPHLLVAGTTGSGKSVGINAMILSLVYRLTPEECRFIMIDPKMLELSIYDGIPHLLTPVVTEPGKAVVALKWAVKEMEQRYRLMSNLSVRNISGYNKLIEDALKNGDTLERSIQTGFDPGTGQPIFETVPIEMKKLPFIVVIVDEMADLMLVAGKDIEASIQRLAQMARAAGIHLVTATQRPSVDVITGVIKANFPTRISFQVTSKIDSRTILGEQGAEQLLGMGDMLYMAGGSRITRVHGAFVDDREVEAVVAYLKSQGTPSYLEEVTKEDEEFSEEASGEGGNDLYEQAVTIVRRDQKASTSYLQRQLKIGYNRAADLIDRMEREGVVTPPNHSGKREVI